MALSNSQSALYQHNETPRLVAWGSRSCVVRIVSGLLMEQVERGAYFEPFELGRTVGVVEF